jgi:hypothetical protein
MLKQVTVKVIPHPFEKKMPKFLAPLETSQRSPREESQETSFLRTWMRRNLGRQFYTIPYDLPSMLNLGRKIPKGYDIINNHNFPSEWAAFSAKKRFKAPVVWMCNEPPFWFFIPELRRGLRKVNWPVFELFDRVAVDYIDGIMVLSHVAQAYVRKAYKRPAKVVRSGTNVELFHNASGESIRRNMGSKTILSCYRWAI